MAHPERLELPTFWFVVKFAFAISLIRLGSAYSLYSGFPGYSGVNGPILDPTCEVTPKVSQKLWAHLQSVPIRTVSIQGFSPLFPALKQ